MKRTTKRQTHLNIFRSAQKLKVESDSECAWLPAYAAEQWREIAERAVANGQSENAFLLSCHVANRPAALKAYRIAAKR